MNPYGAPYVDSFRPRTILITATIINHTETSLIMEVACQLEELVM